MKNYKWPLINDNITLSDRKELEDIYFMKYMEGNGVVDIETAMKFSMEDVFSPNPLGVHNPIRHIGPEQLKKVLYKK
jgi:hypothetical protein